MSIVVATPTGHIGSVVTDELLIAGQKPRLLARHPEKVTAFVRRGATVAQGANDDVAFLKKATQGARALFWLTPNAFDTQDLFADQARFARAAAEAIRVNKIPRVVNLSSIGAHSPVNGGPVDGLHEVERILNDTDARVTHLRPAYFMENYFGQLPSIAQMGSVFMPAPGSTRVPMVATRDIGVVAAHELLDDSWSGRRVRGIHGPADISLDEAAAAIGKALGKPVRHVQVKPEDMKGALLQMGMSENVVDLLVELTVNMGNGSFKGAEKRTPETTTPTRFEQFAREVLVPVMKQAARG